MDNFANSNLGNRDSNEPIPLDKDPDKPIPFDDTSASDTGVSHAPLNLGGSSPTRTPKIEVAKPAAKKPVEKAASGDRITGVKTFFTKLHPGAINFLDEQIGDWLKANPNVQIKHTNVTTGEIQAKKTEPNILITVWY